MDGMKETEKETGQDILEEAHKRLKYVDSAENNNRDIAIECLKFEHGEQWPEKIKYERELEGQPCLVLNRVPAFVRQVVNEIRQGKPSIKAHAIDSESDPDTAEILQGMIRAITNSSNAESGSWQSGSKATENGFRMRFALII